MINTFVTQAMTFSNLLFLFGMFFSAGRLYMSSVTILQTCYNHALFYLSDVIFMFLEHFKICVKMSFLSENVQPMRAFTHTHTDVAHS